LSVKPQQTPEPTRRAFLVGLSLPGQPGFVVEEHLDELAELVESAGFAVAGRTQQSRKRPDPKTMVGRGKAERVAVAARELEADLVIFDDDLSPAQVRNLEELLELEVIDRSALILEIFFQRARTREARTQVELAQLSYMLPRLTRRWTHLSRQAGGIGVRGGEGETQLEVDRRMMRDRIRRLEKDLVKIERTREIQRRHRRGVAQVALAGYTNAGKSTLFNRLTHAGARVEDRLFATLDSKLRRGGLDGGRVAVFSDTVGFIRKLPHHLVASFKSTLEEIVFADLVLHVIDQSHPHWRDQMEVAESVLEELGVDPERILRVFNKRDLVADGARGDGDGVSISALTGEGVEELRQRILGRLDGQAPEPGQARIEIPSPSEAVSEVGDGDGKP
jgi:GTP-binding protein HflX